MGKHDSIGRQESLLQFLDWYSTTNGYPPSIREITEALGLASTSVAHYHLTRLQQEGKVIHQSGLARTWRLMSVGS